MPAALDLLTAGITFLGTAFGTTACTIEDVAGSLDAHWNDLGFTEEIEVAGRRVTFNVVAEVAKSEFSPALTDTQYHALAGRILTRTSDGKRFRIASVETDDLTVRFPLSSVNR